MKEKEVVERREGLVRYEYECEDDKGFVEGLFDDFVVGVGEGFELELELELGFGFGGEDIVVRPRVCMFTVGCMSTVGSWVQDMLRVALFIGISRFRGCNLKVCSGC